MRALKLLITIFLCAAAVTAAAVLPAKLCFKNAEKYTFFCGTSSADCTEVSAETNAQGARLLLSEVCGEAAEFSDFNLKSFLKSVNGKIIFTEKLSDSVNYYCTADLPYSVNLNGTEINLHICVRGTSAKAASPIIFGGY